MPLALTRAIRFAPGAVLRFTPAINSRLLEALHGAIPKVGALLAAAQAARLTIESLDETACRVQAEHFHLELVAAAGAYRLHLAWTDPAGGAPRSLEAGGIALMLGGRTDVYFAQRSGKETRLWLKLGYDAGGAAALCTFPPSFAEHVPAALRGLLPSQVALGKLESRL